MPRKAVLDTPRQGSLDRLMSSKSAVRARLGNDEKVDVDYIEACGAAACTKVDSARPLPGRRAILTVRTAPVSFIQATASTWR